MLTRLGTLTILLASGMLVAQQAKDEQQVTRLVAEFGNVTKMSDAEIKTHVLANDYVHITEDGTMTTSWRIVRRTELPATMDQLNIRIFGNVATATYRWRMADSARVSSVAQVFQRRRDGWRIIATQVAGPDPGVAGPIAALGIVPPKNPTVAAREIHEVWARQLLAADLKTPAGEHAEDLDTIRSIFAEDCVYVNPDGSILSREQVLARGHPQTVQLTGKQVADAVAANKFFHIDERFAVFNNVSVWTSRNPANRDQSLRVYLKRPVGWQMVFVHHGMSLR